MICKTRFGMILHVLNVPQSYNMKMSDSLLMKNLLFGMLSESPCEASLLYLFLYRYDRHSVRSFTATVPNFIWCLGPRCESGQEHAGGTERPIVVCGTCGFRTCFLHNVAWHQSLSCHEYDLMLADMKNVRSAIEKAGTNRVEEVNDRRAKQEQEGNDERLARQLQAWESQEVDVLFGRYLQTNNGTEALGRAGGCLNNDRAQNGTANTTKQANMKEVGEEPRKFRATITRVALSFALIGGCLWCNEAEIRVALYILLNGHLSSLVPRSWQFRLIQATRSPSGRTQRLRLLLISRLVLQIFTSCYLLSGKYDMGLAISIPIVGYLAGILPGIRLIFLVRCMLFTTPMIFNWAKTWSFRSFQVAILGASITHCLRTDILVHSYLPLWLAALLMILITAGNLFKIVTAMRRGCSAAASSTASLVGGVRPMHRVETDYREIRVFAGVFQTVHQPPRAVRENKAGALQHQRSRLTLSKQEQEAASLETVATISKKCPNHLCGQPIEKLGGCHHMKCRS